ncbi:MAG: methylcobamide:CoM methyltransferase MtaA [Methanobacteriaceae archaeon]|nr:methylcobamide:CoM methyltransferase MtaA [Methanobacteriaceae archaeon]
MNFKDNLKAALNGEEVEKVPAISATQLGIVDAMAGSNTTWPKAHEDAEQMAALGAALYEQAGLECARVPFDLTIEAEAMGCSVNLGDLDKTPGLSGNPFETAEDIEIPDNFLENGRIPTVIKAIEILKEKYEDLPIIVGIAGPFTLTGHLMGVENLVKSLKTDSFLVEDVMDISLDAMTQYVEAINEAEPDVICVADPTSSPELLDPMDFGEFAQGALEDLVEEMEPQSILHICGNSRPIFEDMLDCGYNGVSFEEAVDVAEVKALQQEMGSDTQLVGNISTSQTLFSSATDVVKEEVTAALEKGINVLAPSCGIAPKSPLANIKAFVEARNEFYE